MNEGKTNLQWGDDFQMVECSGADAAAQIVKNIYLKEIQMYGMEQVQILSPYKVRSAAGVLELNRSLQDEVNPPVSGRIQNLPVTEIWVHWYRLLKMRTITLWFKSYLQMAAG